MAGNQKPPSFAGRRRCSREYSNARETPYSSKVSVRAATIPTPVHANQAPSIMGHTGIATAGLKELGRYQPPWTKCWIAAPPYHPSSVILDQSGQGEPLGKSALR